MKVFERSRAETVIRLFVVTVLGVFAGGCEGGSNRAADPEEAATVPETVNGEAAGTAPPLTD
ncbi:MAG: hypothetical protein ACR2QM_05985, partial [Longimicrobiales bacterium]